MTDQKPPVGDQAERIAKLEEQIRELQSKVAGLQKQQRQKRRGNKPTDIREALSGETMQRLGILLVLVSFSPVFFAAVSPISVSDSFSYVFRILPGADSAWMLFWQISVLLTLLVGAIIFITSRD